MTQRRSWTQLASTSHDLVQSKTSFAGVLKRASEGTRRESVVVNDLGNSEAAENQNVLVVNLLFLVMMPVPVWCDP